MSERIELPEAYIPTLKALGEGAVGMAVLGILQVTAKKLEAATDRHTIEQIEVEMRAKATAVLEEIPSASDRHKRVGPHLVSKLREVAITGLSARLMRRSRAAGKTTKRQPAGQVVQLFQISSGGKPPKDVA